MTFKVWLKTNYPQVLTIALEKGWKGRSHKTFREFVKNSGYCLTDKVEAYKARGEYESWRIRQIPE